MMKNSREREKRREREGKGREKEKRNRKEESKDKEVKPVIPRTCCHGSLVSPRPPDGPETSNRNGVGISRLASAPPLSKNPAYAPVYIIKLVLSSPR